MKTICFFVSYIAIIICALSKKFYLIKQLIKILYNILNLIGQILAEETAVLAERLRYLNWLDLELMYFPCWDKREQTGRYH